MNAPSPQQRDVIEEMLSPLCVIACAGSGKTLTAVRRVDAVRSRIEAGRGHVALLSFSNVAVDVFGKTYLDEIDFKSRRSGSRICIETFDGFITTKLLRPHAHRTMKCTCMPYLLTGGEPFLSSPKFQFWPKLGKKYPLDLNSVEVKHEGDKIDFCARYQQSTIEIDNGIATVTRLGEIGGYTHALGRYWAFEVLRREPRILAALARRYPQIIVDEAQDVGSIHIAILNLLAEAGSQVTLVGDPSQAIFEFCGADGAYLTSYPKRSGVVSKDLTVNYRSVPSIVATANCLASRADTANREGPSTYHGPYFVAYDKSNEAEVIQAFQSAVVAAGLSLRTSAIVCRATDKKRELRNYGSDFGQGTTKQFASASMARDSAGDYQEAFHLTAKAVVALLKAPPPHLCARMLDPSKYPEFRAVRKLVWEFARDGKTGLPLASLRAASCWHPQLVERVKVLLGKIETTFGYVAVENIGQRLAKTKLLDEPMLKSQSNNEHIDRALRVETVHGVKGETLDAVLYLAKKDHLKAMLNGTGTELGRIGYVALTRARNLFWLAILKSDASLHRDALVRNLFIEWDYTKPVSVTPSETTDAGLKALGAKV